MAFDGSKYTNARRLIDDEYSGRKVANDFGRFTSQQRGNRQISSYRRDFGRGQGSFMDSFARRGLTGGGAQSGVFQQALQRRAGDFTRGLGEMQADQASALGQYDIEGARLAQYRQQALQDLEAEKAREIAQAALNIQAIRPQLGG